MSSTRLDLSRIVHDNLGTKDYFREVFSKKQIYLHHTTSHANPNNDISSWRKSGYRLGTSVIIAGTPYVNEKHYKDGDIYQCFSSKYWALHLGTHSKGNQIPFKHKKKSQTRLLEKHSIGIEMCNAGELSWENGKFYSSFRTVVPEQQVIQYADKYRGNRFFHRYSDAQLASLKQLLHFFCDRYNIEKNYQKDMWRISENALKGESGIFTHASVHSDKKDCHPQPELIQMLRNLEQDQDVPNLTIVNANIS